MTPHDQFAKQLSDTYALFMLALAGLYAQACNAGITPQSITQFQINGQGAVNSLLQVASDAIDHYLIVLDDGAVTRSMRDRQSAFLNTLRVIVTKNLADTVLRAKGSSLSFGQMLKRTNSGIFESLMKKSMEQPLTALDSAGRTWKADALVKTLARDLAYQCLIDLQVAKLAAAGDMASVSYGDPTHGFYGWRLSLTGATSGYPSLASVRAKIFHPNSTAELVPYVHS